MSIPQRTSFNTKYHIVWDERETIGDTEVSLTAMWFPKECYGLIELVTIVDGDWKRCELISVLDLDYKVTIRKAQAYWEEEMPAMRMVKNVMDKGKE